MKSIVKMLPYLFVCALAFYVIPLFGSSAGVFMLILLIAIPAICLISSLIYGMKNKFRKYQILFPVFIGILFVPSIFLYYNESAWIYSIAYAIIALVGNSIGYAVARTRASYGD